MDLRMEEQNFKGQLIAYCNKLELTQRFQEFSTGPPHDPRFTSLVFVNNEMVGKGEDKTKKAATNIAAKNALIFLQIREPKPEMVELETAQPPEPVVHPATPALSLSKKCSPVNDTTSLAGQEVNYIGKFNEYCQKKGLKSYSFEDDRRGPDHIPEFFCSATIGERKFPEAKGKNKKEAKKNAARLALNILKVEHPNNFQLQQIPGLDEANVIQAISASATKSTDKTSSILQTLEDIPSESCDLQITFRSSYNGTPVHPSRPHRHIELAPKFSSLEQVNDKATKDRTFLQDFDDIEELDSGGYGTVFKARKILDHKYYVVKKVKRRSEKDVSEITALANLEHPHIVRYYHSWVGEDFFSHDSSSGDRKTLEAPKRLVEVLRPPPW
ncbi:interferon-induced, double-stranded RNA-activated protein kinase [Pyxicephalus adspersus]|uniref:interferon-induced, double-stranded RNA-activated protein kinase n=1 Tax=Pyxicephalus adspersus TaxID=30357 RepID=UPI003B5B060F